MKRLKKTILHPVMKYLEEAGEFMKAISENRNKPLKTELYSNGFISILCLLQRHLYLLRFYYKISYLVGTNVWNNLSLTENNQLFCWTRNIGAKKPSLIDVLVVGRL